MSAFEFVFSLFGLLLGFSLVEVLGGLVRTLKLRARVRIGWLTPLLGLFVLLDLTSFWSGAWQNREIIPVSYGALLFGLVITGLYYMAAALVFPDEPQEWPDHDEHYLAHRRQVLGAVWLCNMGAFSLGDWVAGRVPSVETIVLLSLYTAFIAGAFATRNKAANGLLLAGLSGLYLYFAGVSLLA